ncbi:YeeE/YedE family protein [Roseobacter sp. HKCCA0434]|uniref:YeeE/YedE family protein n=1 Tax=Roseobacter sp. HKCCA0434 TaxID=3079297 RepID=UPI002905E134|nr:YeeE/YedE family protein [Roseobacter sp. HKCCA0434]
MLDMIGEGNIAALIGAAGGIMLGLAARLGRFCTLGAIEDHLYGASNGRLGMWVAAIGVAVLGSFALIGAGLVDPGAIFYLAQAWSPVAVILGGLMFGYGMALAGNCGYGAVARLGGGDLRNFVIVVVMGLAAYFTLSGPLGLMREALFPTRPVEGTPLGIAQLAAEASGLPATAIGLVLGLALLGAALSIGELREDRRALGWSVAVGLSVVIAWAGMSWLARTGFDAIPPASHSFAAPVGETMLYAMTASGQSLSFGIGSVAGVWLGAFVGSLWKGHFRWEACEDPRELRRQILGAALMGVGAVLALGCSIGQGLSAMSLLALSAPLALGGIYVGARLGLRQVVEGRLLGLGPDWSRDTGA